ncbi:MAG: bacteriohopanetetrol glucosamine biosynthesis glycosyltransferase HpnI [Sphingomonas sp.]
MGIVAAILTLASAIGSLLLVWSAWLIARRGRQRDVAMDRAPAASLLKPLHGDEPRLADKLASALDQAYPAPFEMICGVAHASDRALQAVEAVRQRFPRAALRITTEPHLSGSNAKICNLANIAAAARHDLLVMADSDMTVPHDYLGRLAGALAPPGVGAVTCLYVGRGDAGVWSRLVAAGIDSHFMPATAIGLATGMGHPCMGSTIALDRTTLDAIGGFAAFADILADDHAIGVAVRARGLRVVVPAMILTHGCSETGLRAVLRQELRWNATIAGIDPAGYAGSAILHPLPIALLAWLAGGGAPAAFAVAGAIVARALVLVATARLAAPARRASDRWGPIALIPLRDLLSFALFLASFAVRSVDWRGADIKLGRQGRSAAHKDPSA